MITVTADSAVSAFLGQVKNHAMVRDSQGNVIGFFTPSAARPAPSSFDPLAIARRKASKQDAVTTREVFERLLDQTQDETTRALLQRKIALLKGRDECVSP